jgi:hypothetical protein
MRWSTEKRAEVPRYSIEVQQPTEPNRFTAVCAQPSQPARGLQSPKALYRQVADRGDTDALRPLAWLRERAGDAGAADRLQRFGLTGSGEVATGLDFDS